METREFTVPVEEFKSAVAKEFNVGIDCIMFDFDGCSEAYSFDVKYKVLTESVCVADNRLTRALAIDPKCSIEHMDLLDNTRPGLTHLETNLISLSISNKEWK